MAGRLLGTLKSGDCGLCAPQPKRFPTVGREKEIFETKWETTGSQLRFLNYIFYMTYVIEVVL